MTVYNVQHMSLEELEKTRAELWGTYQDAVCYTDLCEPRYKTMWGETAREAWEDLKTVELVIRGRGGRAEMSSWELEPEARNDPEAEAKQGYRICDECGGPLYHAWITGAHGLRYCAYCWSDILQEAQRGGAGGSKI